MIKATDHGSTEITHAVIVGGTLTQVTSTSTIGLTDTT